MTEPLPEHPSCVLSVCPRGETDMSAEDGGKMALIGKANLLANLDKGQVGFHQQPPRVLDATPEDILVRSLSCSLLELARKVSRAHVYDCGQVGQR